MSKDEWVKGQLKPLSMFEIAKWWAEGIKVVGAGNGAGFITAGAALTPFHEHHVALFFVKAAGVSFFVGIIAFGVAFLMIYVAKRPIQG
jgi:hypothetical protein